jgi:prostaglandin-H2 D-isomerase / glutathione transferase
MPLGQVPILEVDGVVMYQSIAISRFLAKKFGLAGSNDMEAYHIDNAVYNIEELRASE